MPDDPRISTRDAIRKAVGSTPSEPTPPTQTPSPEREPSPSPDATSEKTRGIGDYDPRLVEDLQEKLAALTPERRKDIEPLVAQYRASYDKAFHKAMSEIAELRRKYEATPPSASEEKVETQKVLKGYHKRLEEEKDPAVKEALRGEIERLEEHVSDMFDRLSKPYLDRLESFEKSVLSDRVEQAKVKIDALEDKDHYPASLIEKHRTKLMENFVLYPNLDREEILSKTVPFSELKPILSQERTPTKLPPSSVSSSKESELKESEYKDTDGRWNIKRFIAAASRIKP